MWCTMPLVRSSQRLHLRRDFASNSCIWQSQVVRVYLIMCILGIISCRNQKSSKIWYVLIMPALFQDSFFHKISMGWKVEGGGFLSDSLQVSKHSKPPPPVSSSISTSKKKRKAPNGDSSETRQHCHPKPAELFVVSQARGKSTNQLAH